jgi:nicotinate-nucleotide adenylyltransferase
MGKRIGLYGGSFDPVHLGHLLVAGAAIEELDLDRLLLIPAAQSPFKPTQEPASAGLRVRMLRLAFAGWEQCTVDEQEIQRGGVSYTIDTLRAVRERYPAAALFCLIGGDHLAALPKWRDAEALSRLAEFVVVPRPGENVGPPPEPFRVRSLRGFPLALSSSEVRGRVRAGRPITALVPAAVEEVIRNNALYL